MKSIKWPKHSILMIAIIATWIKTAITYHTSFEIDIRKCNAGIYFNHKSSKLFIVCLWNFIIL